MNKNQNITDVIIVGGGPAGLSAAINCFARGLSCRVISGNKPLLSKAAKINNHLGFENITGMELINSFENHVNALGIEIEKGKISNIMFFDGLFMLNFSGDIIMSKAVILALGQIKGKPFAGEDAFLGRGVSYCATCDGMLFRSKKAIVVGLSAESFEEANFLNSIGVITTFISAQARNDKMHENIKYINGKLIGIYGEKKATSIDIEFVESKETTRLDTDIVFILRDAIAPNNLFSDLLVENGNIKINRHTETNIPGLFAAGDCTGWPLQVSNAVGEGLISAQQAAKYISKLQ